MKNKLKLVAIIYSNKDRELIESWLASCGDLFEICIWSGYLSVPIQKAVEHFQLCPDIDGIVIDDHAAYDPIVLAQLSRILEQSALPLFSASSQEAFPVIGKLSRSKLLQLSQKPEAQVSLELISGAEKLAV